MFYCKLLFKDNFRFLSIIQGQGQFFGMYSALPLGYISVFPQHYLHA